MLTVVVLVIVLSEKFEHGAYVVAILIPMLVGIMLFINRQYAASRRQLADRARTSSCPHPNREERAIVPVPSLNRAVVRALNVARSITGT